MLELQLVDLKLVEASIVNVKLIRKNLKIAQVSQKSYVDKKQSGLEFEVGDQVFQRFSLE